MPPAEESSSRLFVEGSDDKHSVIHLMKRHGVDWDAPVPLLPFVKDTDGINSLLEALPVAAKGSYDRLGVVIDADINVQDRWTQVRQRLVGIGLTVPHEPTPNGTIIDGVRPGSLVGIWLMPDNRRPGRLEEFLKKLISDQDKCWGFAQESTRLAKAHGCEIADELKSSIHTWLAWHEPPGLPFGTAIKATLFRHDSPEALLFVAWFKRLFA